MLTLQNEGLKKVTPRVGKNIAKMDKKKEKEKTEREDNAFSSHFDLRHSLTRSRSLLCYSSFSDFP